jgi:hypothetical protein
LPLFCRCSFSLTHPKNQCHPERSLLSLSRFRFRLLLSLRLLLSFPLSLLVSLNHPERSEGSPYFVVVVAFVVAVAVAVAVVVAVVCFTSSS